MWRWLWGQWWDYAFRGCVCICPRVSSSLLSLARRCPVHYSSIVCLPAVLHFQLVLLARWYVIIWFKQLPVQSNKPDMLQNPNFAFRDLPDWVSFASMVVPYVLLIEGAGDKIDWLACFMRHRKASWYTNIYWMHMKYQESCYYDDSQYSQSCQP